MNSESNLLIQEILRGDENTFRQMYPHYQPAFMRNIRLAWSGTFEEETLVEAYMESIANFYIRVKTKKLTSLDYSVESYLIATGKYWLINENKRRNRNLPIDQSKTELTDGDNILETMIGFELDSENNALLRRSIAKLGKQCRQLLTLSFWDNKKPEAIMDCMGYANLNTVYAAKARCLKELKNLIKKEKEKDEDI